MNIDNRTSRPSSQYCAFDADSTRIAASNDEYCSIDVWDLNTKVVIFSVKDDYILKPLSISFVNSNVLAVTNRKNSFFTINIKY